MRGAVALPPVPLMEAAVQGPSFAVSIDAGVLYGLQSVDAAIAWAQGVARVSRREAIAVPAIKRARDAIAATLGQFPLRLYDADNKPVEWDLLDAPESGTAPTVSWTRVIDDLVMHGVAWLRVTHVGWHGLPAVVARLDPETVTVRPDLRVYVSRAGSGTATEWVPDEQLIRIDSPNDALLVAGARAIRALGLLDAAALNGATGVPPIDFFTPAEPTVQPTDAEVEDILAGWTSARQKRATAYVPAALTYHGTEVNLERLQMVQAREFAITEIARLTGISAEELSVPVESMTYANVQDRRRGFLLDPLGPYRTTLEGRLSMNDVTPQGLSVRFDTSGYDRADDLTAAQTDETLVRSGIMTADEVRARRGLEPSPASSRETVDAA